MSFSIVTATILVRSRWNFAKSCKTISSRSWVFRFFDFRPNFFFIQKIELFWEIEFAASLIDLESSTRSQTVDYIPMQDFDFHIGGSTSSNYTHFFKFFYIFEKRHFFTSKSVIIGIFKLFSSPTTSYFWFSTILVW